MAPTYDIRALPVPPTQSQIKKFSSLRLLCLKTDPEFFGSTYERELAFTEDQWRERLSTHNRATFVASVADSGQEWVGTLAILVPSEMIFDSLAPLRDIGVGKDGDVYMLVGMWVRPEHRRRGLGKRLVEEACDWIRKHNLKDGEVWKDKTVALQVGNNNDGGWALYDKTGFRLLSNVESEDKWMVCRVA